MPIRKHRAYALFGIAWAIAVGLLGCGLGAGVAGPTVLLTDLTLPPGQTGTLQLKVYYLPGVQVFQVGPAGRLAFDPGVVRVEGLKPANGFELFAHSVDNAKGEAVFLLAYPRGSITTGTVLEITVKAVGRFGHRSSVSLTGIDLLADPEGTPITGYRLRAGRVAVGKELGIPVDRSSR